MSSAVIRGDCFKYVFQDMPGTTAGAGTPFGPENTIALPASVCYCADLFSKKNGTHNASIELSTHTEMCAGPASKSCSVAYELQENPSKIRSLDEQHTNDGNALGSHGDT